MPAGQSGGGGDSHPGRVRTPADARLLLDAMCGTLATYLRMCGYDAAYALDEGVEDDDAVLELAREESRTVVTRDAALAGRTDDAVLLRSRDVADQLRELRDAGFLLAPGNPGRCSTCNGGLERVEGDATTPGHAPDPGEHPVWRCRDCGQHYWRGSHWADVAATLADLRAEAD